MDFATLFREFGLGTALSICVFIAFFFLLKWVLRASTDQLAQMAREREAWNIIQQGHNEQSRIIGEQMKANMVMAKTFYDSVVEAHRFQRDEHKEMITCLARINGYKT